jgi:transposase
MDDKLISTKKASKILNVSVSTVSRWYDRGVLTGEKNPLTNEKNKHVVY